MVNSCAVADCKNNKLNRSELKFHNFPADKHLCSKWVLLCKRKDEFIPKNSHICSEHFDEKSYRRDLKGELLGLPLKRVLVPGAYPTIFRNRVSADKTLQLSQSINRYAVRERKKLVREIIYEYDSKKENLAAIAQNDVGTQTTQRIYTQDSCNYWKKLCDAQRIKIKKLQKENRILKKSLQEEKGKITKWRRKRRNNFQPVVGPHGLQILSPAQNKLLNGKQKVNWSRMDIIKALSVRSVSIKAYEIARKCWGLPLPTARTLRNWTRNFGCNPGILSDVLEVMKSESSQIAILNRICVLSYDEMSISSTNVLDKSDNGLKTGSKAQVLMARGICDGWKQPIYYDFDQAITKEILLKIIECLEESGYPVHAIVSDLGAENRGLWKELQIDIGKNKFINPENQSRNIYVLADVPHMIKLLRNHILDDGVVLSDGSILDKNVFVNLVEQDNTEIKRCPKLSMKLVEISGPARMRVRPAAQLLSHHVACLASSEYSQDSKIVDFITIVNDGFDVLNSRVKQDTNVLRSGFGLYKNEQITKLKNLKSLMLESRFLTKLGNQKRALLPFQKGFVVSIDSVTELFEDLQNMYNVNYLLTSRLNQDALESLFSRIRAFGGPNTSPTVCEFKYRLRLLLLGSQVRPPSGTNTVDEYENCNWISAKLILKNNLLSSQGSKSFSAPPVRTNIENLDALEYLAGYIAFKLKKQNYDFGSPADKTMGKKWIHILSRGGLLVPHDSFYKMIKMCNDIFEAEFSKIKTGDRKLQLIQLIQQSHPEILTDIVKTFIDVRIKLRANYLNRSLQTTRKSISCVNKLKHFVKQS